MSKHKNLSRLASVASVALSALALPVAGHAEETIKVGLLTVDAGPFALYMSHTQDAAAFAIDYLNAQGGALGRKYELVNQTYNGTPAGAVATVGRLSQQNVAFITGFSSSATALATGPKLASFNALLLDPTAQSDELTGKGCQQNYFRFTINDSMSINALRALVKRSGIKSWSLIMPDYATGHDFAKSFTALVGELGGSVGVTVFAPLATTDFGGYISQLAAKPADGLAVVFPGSGGVAFAKQQKQFALFARFKTVVSANFTSELVIDAQGDSTVGVLTTLPYSWEMPGERNAAFVKAWEQRFKRKPSYADADNFQAYELLNAAITKAKSTDVTAVRTALSGLKTQTVVGDVEMRAGDHQLSRAMTVVQVAGAGEGKGVMKMQTIEPAAVVVPPVSAECRM
ncbi:MAG TPA: ABC transporter substrate-binding protein [Burkholderiaceae bacterium]|jgi:branched-chain amino acid transport system substrate-binding protein